MALAHLDDAAAARLRLDDPEDGEALHDFRVALRRLRSWERAFRPFLKDGIRPKLRRRLRALARATGASRDAEVHLAWLADEVAHASARERAGFAFLQARLTRERAEADASLQSEIDAEFGGLRERLVQRLERYRDEVHLREVRTPPTFAAALAPRVRDLASELRAHLARVATIADETEAHEARIAGKRLRYLLEPIVDQVPGARELVSRLKKLQDAVGDLHDAQLFARAVRDAIPDAEAEQASSQEASAVDRGGAGSGGGASAGPRAPVPRRRRRDPRPGLEAIGARLDARAERAFASFASDWLGGRAAAFFDDVGTVAARVEAESRGGTEIERKYLLRALPDEVRDAPSRLVEQGYLPGERLEERVRRVVDRDRGGKRERYYRTVKLGGGITRTEIEEEIDRSLFDALWRLTKGRRVRKRRHVVEAGARRWEIDEFLDRDLVLAETELRSEDETVELPGWLERRLEREVTGDPEFRNATLAR